MTESKTVLLIEDDAAVADMFMKVLKHFGYKTVWKNTAEEGIEAVTDPKAGDCNYAMIISDTELPNKPRGGWDVLAKAQIHLPTVPRILTSGNVVQEGQRMAENLGAAFLEKPFSIKRFLEALNQAKAKVTPKE